MRTFIQVIEVWTPNADRTLLTYRDGLYGRHHQFRLASEPMAFSYGEGLPGRAWEGREPILLQDLQNSYFLRGAAAARAGLTCAVALPIFAGDYLLAVLVFFCGADDDHVGAIELWRNDPRLERDMGLVEGYFGIAESFRWVAANTRFMRGFGLPGLVWQSGQPEVMRDMVNSSRFVRRDDARRVGLNKGLGLPVFGDPHRSHVMTFLSAMGTPIARRFEVWVPSEADPSALVFSTGDCDRRPEFALDYQNLSLPRGSCLLARAGASGVPAVSESIATESSPVGASARLAGLHEMLALPVIDQGRLKAVVGFYF
jgi:hypothetical protein